MQPSRPRALRPGQPGTPPPKPSPPSRSAAPAAAPSQAEVAATALPLLDAAVFRPDQKATQKAATKGPEAVEKLERRSRQQAVQLVNSVRLLAPAVLAAMLPGGTDLEQAERFARWAALAREKAARCVSHWALETEDVSWVQAAIERLLAEHPAMLDDAFPDTLLANLPSQVPLPPPAWMPLQSAAPLALLQGLAPVQRVQLAFPLGRVSPEEDLLSAARTLAEAGQDAAMELLDPAASTEIRTAVFAATVAEAGKTLAQVWMHAGQAFQSQVQKRSAAEQARWEQAHPEGADLEPVFQAFRESAARLRRLAQLSRPRG